MKSYKVICKCKHDFQDKVHGTNIRVANPCKGCNTPGQTNVRCTVCGQVHTVKI